MRFKMKFVENGIPLILNYDTLDNRLSDENDVDINFNHVSITNNMFPTPHTTLPIYLGNKLNAGNIHSLFYDTSRVTMLKEAIDLKELDSIISILNTTDLTHVKVEFWGGEPLIYLDEIKYIIDRTINKPLAFFMVTDGSLLDLDFAKYCIDKNMFISIEYGGTSQYLRNNIDILDNPVVSECITYLLDTKPYTSGFDTVKFNIAMIDGNYSVKLNKEYISKKLDISKDRIKLNGEGSMYNIKPNMNVINIKDIYSNIISNTLIDYQTGYLQFFRRILHFLLVMRFRSRIETLTTKCGVGGKNVDLKMVGDNMVTCQSINYPFDILYFKDRTKCKDCIAAHICIGGCPAIPETSSVFNINCDIKYQESLAIFTLAVNIIFSKNYILKEINDLKI